jgi:peptidoglycan/xylan/chitin deacetylase (PgdA/CDA1 family)
VYEGIPRILDLMGKHQVKLSSFMIGQAVDDAHQPAGE